MHTWHKHMYRQTDRLTWPIHSLLEGVATDLSSLVAVASGWFGSENRHAHSG